MEAAHVVDENRLRLWLKEQPIEVARAIAHRAAMRVLPHVLEIHTVLDAAVTPNIKFLLTLQSFRAGFIAGVATRNPTVELLSASKLASSLTFSATHTIAGSGDFTDAENSARAACFSAARAITFAASVVASDEFDARAVALAITASQAAQKASRLVEIETVWTFVRGDAKAVESKKTLTELPLWLGLHEGSLVQYPTPSWIETIFSQVVELPEFSRNGKWRFWLEWYRAEQEDPTQGIFTGMKELVLASQPPDFWEGQLDEVMDRVVEVVNS